MRANDAERAAVWERALREALQPVELPMGFADRVVTAAAEGRASRKAKVLPMPPFWGTGGRWRMAVGGAVAASLMVGSFAAEGIHQRRVRAQAQAAANQQFAVATRVTDEALARMRVQLRRAGVAVE